jgi:hypothetical protein
MPVRAHLDSHLPKGKGFAVAGIVATLPVQPTVETAILPESRGFDARRAFAGVVGALPKEKPRRPWVPGLFLTDLFGYFRPSTAGRDSQSIGVVPLARSTATKRMSR